MSYEVTHVSIDSVTVLLHFKLKKNSKALVQIGMWIMLSAIDTRWINQEVTEKHSGCLVMLCSEE